MDLLNLNYNDVAPDNGKNSWVDPNKLNPDLKLGNGNYKVIGRFIPYWKNPKQSKYKKYSARLINPVTNDNLFIDCPSTVNKSSILWTLDILLKNKKDNNQDLDLVEEIKKYFNRYYTYTSPFYVIKDPQVETNENKILLYSYGYNIDNILTKLANPESIDTGMGVDPIQACDPFSLTNGADFFLVVKKGNKHGKDYTASKFIEKTYNTPLKYMYNGQMYVCKKGATTEEHAAENARLMSFLKDNTPEMEQYYYNEWTDSDYKNVATFLKAIIPYNQFMSELLSKSRDQRINQLLTAINTDLVTTELPRNNQPAQLPDYTMYNQPITQQAPVQQAPVQQAPVQQAHVQQAKPTNQAKDEFSDLLGEL